VADERVGFHALHLPDAAPEAMESMVRGQLEVLFPGQDGLLRYGWTHCAAPAGADGRSVTLCAMRADGLDRLVAQCRRLRRAPSKSPSAQLLRPPRCGKLEPAPPCAATPPPDR
jgi:hypothetical protein